MNKIITGFFIVTAVSGIVCIILDMIINNDYKTTLSPDDYFSDR